jgi:hypothetical protein
MITKDKNKKIEYVKVSSITHAGDIGGQTAGGKTHVLNFNYQIDKDQYPEKGIEDVIISISDSPPTVDVPKIKYDTPESYINQILTFGRDLKIKNANQVAGVRTARIGNLENTRESGFAVAFSLVNTFCNPSVRDQDRQTGYHAFSRNYPEDGRSTRVVMREAKNYYGKRQTMRLFSVSDIPAKSLGKIVPPISLNLDGVGAKVSIKSADIGGRDPSKTESDITGGDAYQTAPGQSAQGGSGFGSKEVPLRADISKDLKSGTGNPIESAKISAEGQAAQRYSNPENQGASQNISYLDAAIMSIYVDKIDPAKSAIIPTPVKTGHSPNGTNCQSDEAKDLIAESKNQISKSKNQTAIKEHFNKISKIDFSSMAKLDQNDIIAIPSVSTDRFQSVSQLIPINSSQARGYNKLFASISVYAMGGEKVQTYDFEIPVKNIVSSMAGLKKAPRVSACVSKKGTINLDIEQMDKKADAVEVFARYMLAENSENQRWFKIADSPLKTGNGSFFVEHIPESSGPILYRVVPKSKKDRASIFGSVVVNLGREFLGDKDFPDQSLGEYFDNQDTDQNPGFCIPVSQISKDGNVTIDVSSVKGGQSYVSIVRRNTGRFETSFKDITTKEGRQLVSQGDTARFTDIDAQFGEEYEYAVKMVDSSGNTKISPIKTSVAHTKPVGDISLGINKISEIKGSGKDSFNVAISISTKIAETGSHFIAQALEKSGVPKERIEQATDLVVKANQMTGVLIKRIDMISGEMVDLGFFPTGQSKVSKSSQFIDMGDRNRGIQPPTAGKKYKYMLEAVVGDIETIIEEISNQSDSDAVIGNSKNRKGVAGHINKLKRRDMNDLTFTDSNETGLVSDPDNPNRPEKFFNPRSLGSGKLAGTIITDNISPVQSIYNQRTGVCTSAEIDLSQKTQCLITKPRAVLLGDRTVRISWSVTDYQNIDHFLVQEIRHGATSTIQAAHCTPSKGSYYVIDPEASHKAGKVSYKIIAIGLDYLVADSKDAGSVVIPVEDEYTVLVNKDLPDTARNDINSAPCI